MPTEETTSYRRLFEVAGFPRVATGLLLGRVADNMWQLALILFVLARFHSPVLAGVAVFSGAAPGKVVSPIVGALLDRYGRTGLVVLDYTLAATMLGGIALLDRLGVLTPLLLCVMLIVLGTTQPLSETGLRSLFPVLVPRHLWDRANAVDSSAFVVATLVGPAAGGLLVAIIGPQLAIVVIAVVFGSAALVTSGVKDPPAPPASGEGLWTAAWVGLRYVFANPTLRGLGIVISLLNVGGGIIFVGVPVLLQQNLGQSSAVTGLVLACFGLAGLVSGIIFGKVGSEGRERLLLALGNGVIAVGVLLLATGGPLWLLVIAMLIAGAGNGPCDIALFALRQRRTEPRMLGRAMAVSMAINGTGIPIGAAIAGWLLGGGHTAAVFVVGGAVTLIGVALIPLVIPRDAHQ